MSVFHGVQVLQQYGWSDMIEHFERVEASGFDAAFLADHYSNPFGKTIWLECWTLLAALASKTQRMRLGSLVSTPIYRNPAVIAQQAFTLDLISEGRLDLGLGAGVSPFDHFMSGAALWSARERVDRLDEFVELVDQVLRKDVTTYEGRYYRVAEAEKLGQCVQSPRPRLLVAAEGMRSVRIAAQRADAWVCAEMDLLEGQGRTLDDMRALVEKFGEFATEAGREPDQIDRFLLCGFCERTAFQSIQGMHDMIGTYRELGFTGFIFNYMPGFPEQSPPVPGMRSFFQFLNSPERLDELAGALGLDS